MLRLSLFTIALLALGLLAGVARPVQAREMSGIITSVQSDRDQFTFVGPERKMWIVQVVPDAKVFLDGKEVNVLALRADFPVTIVCEQQDDERLLTTEVRARSIDAGAPAQR